jgi:hypothetical protein
VLFLFFNTDLVQSRIDLKGGSMAFINNYSAWIIGLMAEENRDGIQALIDRALAWERCSRAIFEYDKMTIVHFMRIIECTSRILFIIKGEVAKPKQKAKILGVVMDMKLRFKRHMAKAATKGLIAAICLRRLKMLSLYMARQLFMVAMALAMDYASII